MKKSKRSREKKQQRKKIRREQSSGTPFKSQTIPTRTSRLNSVEEEKEQRQQAATGMVRNIRNQLPILLERFRKIPDPRNPNKIKHKLTLLMLYGILVFVFQCSSRREANKEITRPMFEKNLRLLFPDIKTLPHADTLFRLLSEIDTSQIEQAHIDLIKQQIRNKKFKNYLINNCYPIAMDGSQKIAFNELWDENLLQRKSGKKIEVDGKEEKQMQYFIYILEASLSFKNGMVIPLMSEFLEYNGEDETKKQDSEQKAFHRLIKRLRDQFPRLPILLLLDGLYANGPIMAACREQNLDFMIVLKNDSLSTVLEEYHSLINHEDSNNRSSRQWGGRSQQFIGYLPGVVLDGIIITLVSDSHHLFNIFSGGPTFTIFPFSST